MKYLFYRFKWWLADKFYEPSRPLNLDLELAGKCNLACVMCPYGTGGFSEEMQGMMPHKMAVKALEQGARLKIPALKLNFRGEPGLCKYLGEMIVRAKALGYIDIFFNTNLLSFSEERLFEIAKANPTKIIVSVDGASEETYEYIRKGGDFDKLKRNFAILKTALHHYSSTTKVIVQMVVQDSNRHEAEEIKTFGADEYRFVEVQDRGAGEGVEINERRRCPQPFQRLVLSWDGTIFPCCSNWNNEYPLGNINDMTLKDAWKSSRMEDLRDIQRNVTLNENFPCKACQVKGSYK